MSPVPTAAAEPELPADLPAEFLERYKIVRLLGTGSMGRVYEAVQHSLRRRVAIKMVRHDVFRNPDAARRFEQEALILARLSHPNIVTLYDAGLAGDVPYFSTEYVNGVTLAREMGEAALPREKAVELVLQLLDGLKYLHANGVVHRDLKPDNIFIAGGQQVKIIDFGLAKALEGSLVLTQDGLTVGTPMYMAPEQILGQPVSPAWDVYAVGVILFRMLSGKFPWRGGSAQLLIQQKIDEQPAKLASVLADASERLQAAVDLCLEASPEKRLRTCDELRRLLVAERRATRGRGSAVDSPALPPAASAPTPETVATPSATRSPPEASLGFLAGGLTLALVAAAIGVGLARARMGPLGQRAEYLPASLEIQPLARGHRIVWSSALRCAESLVLDGRRLEDASVTTRHSVVAEGLEEGTTVHPKVLLSDGSTSTSFVLEVPRFRSLGFRVRRRFDAATIGFEAGLDVRVEGRLVPSKGEPRSLPPRPPARRHEIELTDLERRIDYSAFLTLRAGETSFTAGPLALPSPIGTLTDFTVDLDKTSLGRVRDEIFFRHGDKGPPLELAHRIEQALARMHYRSRLPVVASLIAEAADRPDVPVFPVQSFYEQVKELHKTDIFCEVLGIPFRSGAEVLEVPRFRQSTTPAIAPAREIEIPIGSRQEFTAKGWAVLFSGKIEDSHIHHYRVRLTRADVGSRAELAMLSKDLLPGGAFEVTINRGREASLPLFFPRPRDQVRGRPTWLYHTIDPRSLRVGENELILRYSAFIGDASHLKAMLDRLVLRVPPIP